MIPAPGGQNSMPYFFAADSRKSNTSLLPLIEAGRSMSVPRSPTIIWSQCMLVGTAVDGSPQDMNWRIAICAEASCMATLSGLSLRLALPLIWAPLFVFDSKASSGSSRCEYRIFSASVNRLSGPRTLRTRWRFLMIFEYGGIREATFDFAKVSALVSVAKCRVRILPSWNRLWWSVGIV